MTSSAPRTSMTTLPAWSSPAPERRGQQATHMSPNPKMPDSVHPTEFNIAAIAKLEQDALSSRTFSERASDAVTKFAGSAGFLFLHLFFILAWVAINLGLIPGIRSFDPFPFGI